VPSESTSSIRLFARVFGPRCPVAFYRKTRCSLKRDAQAVRHTQLGRAFSQLNIEIIRRTQSAKAALERSTYLHGRL